MKRLLLLSLFLVLMVAEMLGVDLSLGPGLSVKNAYLYVILLALGIETAVTKQGRLELLRVHIPFLLLISYAILSWLVLLFILAPSGYAMFETLIMLKNQLIDHYLFFFVFFYAIRSQEDVLWIVKYMLLIIVLGNVITLIDSYNVPDLGIIHERGDGRVSGPLGQSNQYAAFLILFLPSLAVASWRAIGPTRLFHIFGLLASIAVLVLTTSRGALVGLAGGMLLGTLYLRHFIRPGQALKTAITISALAALALIAVGYHYSDLLYSRFIEQTGAQDIRYVSSGRSQIWIAVLSKLTEQPITLLVGYGWGMYDLMANKGIFEYATHNTYLNYLFNLGMIGLGLFLALLGSIIHTTKKAIGVSNAFIQIQLMAFLFGFLSLLIHLFFLDLHKPWLFVWAYVGITLRLAVTASTKAVPVSRQA